MKFLPDRSQSLQIVAATESRQESIRLLDLLPHHFLHLPWRLEQGSSSARPSRRRLPSLHSDTRTLIVRSSGRPSDSANTSAGGAYTVCERQCLDSWDATTSGAGSVVQLSAGMGAGARGAAGAGANNIGSARGDRVGEQKYSLGSSETMVHVPAVFAFAGSASRCTIRFIRFVRGFALVVERSGDSWCDEAAGESTRLLDGPRPLPLSIRLLQMSLLQQASLVANMPYHWCVELIYSGEEVRPILS